MMEKTMENPRLLVLSDIMRGQSFVVEKEKFVVGRLNEKDIDLTIGDKSLSGRHAIISREQGRTYITDLESTNGTRINGNLIVANTPTKLSSGDVIELGQIELIFDTKHNTTIEMQTGIDLSSTIGNIEEDLLTNISPFEQKNEKSVVAKKNVRYSFLFLFVVVIILVVLSLVKLFS